MTGPDIVRECPGIDHCTGRPKLPGGICTDCPLQDPEYVEMLQEWARDQNRRFGLDRAAAVTIHECQRCGGHGYIYGVAPGSRGDCPDELPCPECHGTGEIETGEPVGKCAESEKGTEDG